MCKEIKLAKYIIVALLVFATSVATIGASGTFIYPPPPKVNVEIDQATLDKGKQLFEKETAGQSCKGCHSKGGSNRFRRSKLARVLNKTKRWHKKGSGTDLSQLNESELKAVQLFLADKFRLMDYLK